MTEEKEELTPNTPQPVSQSLRQRRARSKSAKRFSRLAKKIIFLKR